MDLSAKMLPANTELVPRVAELPICQKTLQAEAPLIRRTDEYETVIRDEPVWKIHTLWVLFWASSVKGPVSRALLLNE